jgi:hypothetical protein
MNIYLSKIVAFTIFLTSIYGALALQNGEITKNENFQRTIMDTVFLWNGKSLNGLELIIKTKNGSSENSYIIKERILHFFGNQIGYFRTKEKYSNYKLHVEWRWPEADENGNSGILIHTQQPDTVWPKCIQVQLKKDNAGDLIAMNGSTLKETIGKPKETAIKLKPSNEFQETQWNSCEVQCAGDSLLVYVNGLLQNSGTGSNLSPGTIGFQLEGKPIEFRNLYLLKNKE